MVVEYGKCDAFLWGLIKCIDILNYLQNVSPTYAPDVVVFIDSITMVFEEASSSGPPLSLPVSCTEAGNDYSLPNLALRFCLLNCILLISKLDTCI